MYKYRLYPNQKQIHRLSEQLKVCRLAYNELLETSIETYKNTGKRLTKFDLDECIKYLDIDTSVVFSQIIQNLNDRINKAFQNFFRRLKEKQSGKHIKVGFPRFKKHFKSITYPQFGFKLVSDKRLYVSKVGNIPIILHRIPKGKIKTMTIKRSRAGHWFVIFSCEIEIPSNRAHPNIDRTIGADVGIESYATLSSGVHIPNPKHLIRSERKLKRLQRKASRKVKGSRNRGKSIHKLAKAHIIVSNQRRDFQHKLSRILTNEFGTIAVEDLNIKGMVRNHHLAKHIHDASWNNFIQLLCYKAEWAGGKVLKNPRTIGSSIRCFNCGKDVPKPLSVRIHCCPFCDVVLHRDHNSALNHLKDTVGLTGIHACGDSTSTTILQRLVASGIVEAGTIFSGSQFH
jgi:putative transposase